ncbi:MAG: hypothetical protein HYU60_08115 [Magnetospirillum sp.]|nr:hypothetical protein [Magnetospirillum sp.]
MAILLLATPAVAAERCPPPGMTPPSREVTLTVAAAPVQYRNDRSRAEITVLAGRHDVPLHVSNTGLTRHRTEFRVSPHLWWVELGNGRRCVGVGKVEARWAISETTVDVASEYPPGSCQYRVVREHEEEHVTLTRNAFDRMVPRMKGRLDALVGRLEPFVTDAGSDAAGNQLLQSLMDGVRPILDQQERLRHELNMAIDTPESYRRTSARCPDW